MPGRRRGNPPPDPGRAQEPPVGELQRIPAVDPPRVQSRPAPPSPPPPAGPPAEVTVVRPPAGPVCFAGCFTTAATALRCAADLASASDPAEMRFGRHADTWWVIAEADLDFGRSHVHANNGIAHVRLGKVFARDRGFGRPPETPGSDPVKADDLHHVTVLDLVAQAGIYPQRPAPQREAIIVMPGAFAADVVRRAMDLHLKVAYRPVRMTPLFSAPPGDGATAMVQLSMLASADSMIPASVLSAIARNPLTAVCHTGGPEHSVMVQRGMAAPVSDARLQNLVDGDAWLLADSAFGCWRVFATSDFVPGSELVRLGDGFSIHSEMPLGDYSRPERTVVRLVPEAGRRMVDAVLLRTEELSDLALILEQDPLSDSACLVPGEAWHLVIAPGGLLQDLGLGEPLVCVGPGPLFVPLGRRLQPRMPASARLALYRPDESHAVVVNDDSALRFQLDARRPVWTLWLGEPAMVDVRLPAQTHALLREIDGARDRQSGSLLQGWRTPAVPRTETLDWREEALRAELAGDLAGAAALHQSHNEPLRAAHLFERAAIEWAETPDEPARRRLWTRRRRPE